MGNTAIDTQLLQRVPGSEERDDVSSNNVGSVGIVRAAEAKDRKMGPVGGMREREVDTARQVEDAEVGIVARDQGSDVSIVDEGEGVKRGYGKLKKGFKVLHRGHEEMREAVGDGRDDIPNPLYKPSGVGGEGQIERPGLRPRKQNLDKGSRRQGVGEREDSPERGSSKGHRPPLMACHGSRNPEVGGLEGPRGYEDPLSLLKENLSLDHL